jgi:hypothetical protein
MTLENHVALAAEQTSDGRSSLEARDELLTALRAASGYLLNAKIDLETGAPKRTAIDTINGGLRIVGAALAKATGEKVNRVTPVARLESALNSCLEYLDNYVDVVDGDYGVPAPNKAMQLVNEINEALGKGGY